MDSLERLTVNLSEVMNCQEDRIKTLERQVFQLKANSSGPKSEVVFLNR